MFILAFFLTTIFVMSASAALVSYFEPLKDPLTFKRRVMLKTLVIMAILTAPFVFLGLKHNFFSDIEQCWFFMCYFFAAIALLLYAIFLSFSLLFSAAFADWFQKRKDGKKQ